MKRFCLFLLLLAIYLFSHSQKVYFTPEVYVLDNGLTVYLNPDPHASTVFGLVAVKAGSKNDPADATGLAHYQEHMLFKGTKELGTTDWERERVHIDRIFQLYDELAKTTDEGERKAIQMRINAESLEANKYAVPNELDKLLKSFGSTKVNAFTSTDMTAYFNEFPPTQIEKWLEVYSHRFIYPVFRGFQAELEVVYEEYNMYNDMFVMPLFEEFGKKFFKKHPYGQQSVIGTLDHLKNPSLTKMYQFFKTWYVPNNMALILSGNFDVPSTKLLIRESFERLEMGEIPRSPEIIEEDFSGRELVEVKMSPVKIGILGFRTVPANHPDQYALQVFYRLLSNSGQTGYLDKLNMDNQLTAAMAMPMPYKDQGALLILTIPKIIGQSFEAAEQLVLGELKKVVKGEFSDQMLENIKQELYIEYVSSIESHQNICVMLAQSFVNEESIDDFLGYPEKIMDINKQDIVSVGEKYFGNNYLAFFSGMGIPKKHKIEKPGYEPIVSNTELQSEYYRRISSWQTPLTDKIVPEYHHLVEKQGLENGATLYFSENPYNDIFTYRIRFYLTQPVHPLTELTVRAMDLAQTSQRSLAELKESFATAGVNYSFWFQNDIAEIRLQGLESGFNESVNLLRELLQNPVIDNTRLKVLYNEAKASRKLENADAESIADMLYDYIVFGNFSPYINRPSLREIKGLKPEQLTGVFSSILKQPAEFHYTGSRQGFENARMITNRYFTDFTYGEMKKRSELPKQDISENRIIFVHKKNTLQSKIFFFTIGNEFTPKEETVADMFNSYFGGGFSGLVLREIREFRSMAYSAGAGFSTPLNMNSKFTFTGYIGTQADKTIEAIDIFMELLRNMPEKKEETELIKEYLKMSLFSKMPDFRSVTTRYAADRFLGRTEDPLLYKHQMYDEFDFSDISAFHRGNLKNRPVAIMVVADKKRLNPKELSKYGKVEILKSKKLYKK
jgi:zinc protease